VARPDEDGGTAVPPVPGVCDATGECPPTPAKLVIAPAALPLWLLLVIATAGAGGLVVGAAGTAWWLSHHESAAKIASQERARPAAYSPQDRRLSVIVLPFENSSEDPAQDPIAAGITRDVTDVIVAYMDSPTVPAPVAARYRGKAIDLKAIGREHDVHFAIIGNARREAGHLIVAANVYGTADGGQVWAKRFDLPDNPDEWKTIARDIGSNYVQAAMDSESARALREHPDDLDKRDLMFAVSATPMAQVSEANLRAQLALIERALALDPDYVAALRERARKLAQMVSNGFSSDRDRDLAMAATSVERALLINPDDYWTLREKAVVLSAQRNYNDAAALLRRLIERRPQAFRHVQLANILMIQGHYSDALENFITARRLAVGSDAINTLDAGVAFGLLGNDRFSEAIEQARLAITEFPPESGRDGEHPWLILIAAESIGGHEEEARADLSRFLTTPRKLRSMTELEKLPQYASNPKLLEGLRRAGMSAE
jgi:TolB-like protein